MELVLTAALVIGAISLVWAASQLGFAWVVVALVLSLGSLIYVILRQRAEKVEEHLYERAPSVATIRQPLTPMEYSYRSNLDIPFFSFESQNYGKKMPRKRVRGIPIDRFIEFESKTDALLKQLHMLHGQLELMNNKLLANLQPLEQKLSSEIAASPAVSIQLAAEVAPKEKQPRFDTTLPAVKPSEKKSTSKLFNPKALFPVLRPTKSTSRTIDRQTNPSIYDEIGNVCGSCGGRLKNFQCVDRCDPLSQ
jgi:hypothetical protein